jgi:hypothetical protein
MSDSSAGSESDPPIPASKTFSELTKEIARRNEAAHQAARELRAVNGRLVRAQMRARELR